jgi:serine protease AprX
VSSLLRKLDFKEGMDQHCRLIVETVNGRRNKAASVVDSLQGKVRREIKLIPSLVIDLPVIALPELAKSGCILRIWHDAKVQAALDNVLPSSGSAVVQNLGYTGRGVVVAVLDTGIFPHDDLTTPENRILAWNDIINHKTYVYDDNGHGTCVAGIIAGNGVSSDGKYKGLAPEARLVGVKILDQEGTGRISDLISGLEWCLTNLTTLNIKIINLSVETVIQASYPYDPVLRSIGKAWEKGVVVCMASSSKAPEYRESVFFNSDPKLITVGNLNEGRTITVDDERLNPVNHQFLKPDLITPGSEVTSLTVDGKYDIYTGNSMATPIVAGGIAQMIQKWPLLKPDQIKYLLLKNAKDTGLGSNLQGAGIIDLAKVFGVKNRRSRSETHPVTVDNPGNNLLNNNILNTVLNLIGSNFSDSRTNGNGMMLKALMSLLTNQFKS